MGSGRDFEQAKGENQCLTSNTAIFTMWSRTTPWGPNSEPDDLRDEYIALLDYYSKEELDAIRAEHGDQFISMLFESEFGEDYESLYEEGVM